MDVNKNSYTITFATLLVILVAALLSSASIGLKPFQSKNIVQEKKQNILKSVGIDITREEADVDYESRGNFRAVVKVGQIRQIKQPRIQRESCAG